MQRDTVHVVQLATMRTTAVAAQAGLVRSKFTLLYTTLMFFAPMAFKAGVRLMRGDMQSVQLLHESLLRVSLLDEMR